MNRGGGHRMLDFLAPFLSGVGSVAKLPYKVFLGWWLDPWLTRTANRALRDDVEANLYFLMHGAHVDVSTPATIQSFDYACVKVHWENLLVTITQGRGDTSVCIAPRHAPSDSYELGRLIAALEQRPVRAGDMVSTLRGAADLLRPRLQQLNVSFAEQEFQRTKKLLW